MARSVIRERPPAGELTWTALNDFLRGASEDEARVLLVEERAGRRRKLFMARIASRITKVAAAKLPSTRPICEADSPIRVP